MPRGSLVEYALLSLAVGALFGWRSYSGVSNGVVDSLTAASIGGLVHALVKDAPFFFRRRRLYWTHLVGLALDRRVARVSMAALIRLPLGDDCVLLVRNRKTRMPAAFGGVLKYYTKTSDRIERELEAASSTFATEGDAVDREKYRNDLRLKMPLRNLRKFLAWFASGGGREDYPLREFWEELEEAGVANVRTSEVEFSRYQTVSTIRWEEENQWYSLLNYDVWEAHPEPALTEAVEGLISLAESADAETNGLLFRATRSELIAGRLARGRFKGTILGDNSWALDRGVPIPRGWWRAR